MGHTDRTYEIVEDGIGPPLKAPQNKPVLSDKGHIIPPDELIRFNKTDDDMRKVDHYRIKFDIKHFNQSRLRFTPNKDDMLWVKKGSGPSKCPTTACHDLADTIWVDKWDEEDGEWIEVINMDMAVEEFWFTLNLVDKNNPTSTTYVPVDPGGGNQNGGRPGSGFKFKLLGTLGLGVCAGLVAFFGARLLLTP